MSVLTTWPFGLHGRPCSRARALGELEFEISILSVELRRTRYRVVLSCRKTNIRELLSRIRRLPIYFFQGDTATNDCDAQKLRLCHENNLFVNCNNSFENLSYPFVLTQYNGYCNSQETPPREYQGRF
jgi:hypothetical protein